jgi:dTDP-4-amino-4,6-dideoxygalactose transaminase
LSIMRRICGVDEHSWHLFPVLVSEDLSVSRNTFIEALATSGVGVSVHYKPLHQLTYYKEAFQFRAENYPGAESLWLSTISLPIYSSMTIEEINHVVGCVSELATRYS